MIRKYKLLLFILLGLLSARLSAGPVEDLIRRAGNAADYPNDNQLVIFDSTRVEVRDDGLGYFYTHRLHKVLTSHGALDLSVIRHDYDPLTAMAEIRKVVIYRADGGRETLDMKQVLDYAAPARAIYWGAREKMIAVGRLEPGDAVEIFLFKKGFTYALLAGDEDEQYIPPMRGHFYDIVPFWSDYPILEKVYQVLLPITKTLQYQIYNGEANTSSWLDGEKVRYTFSKKNILPMKAEPGMVDKSDVATKLLLSTSPDWKAKSLWFHGVNEAYGSFKSTPAIQAKVNEILRGAKDELDSISRLTHWCADEIRYSGISMGKGEGFTLHTGDMTFTDRCGVCKDKAGMLITMLRAAGFQSYPAMTMAGSRIDYIPADQFNHCVTVVKRSDGKYHLLDPTWVPFLRELWSSAEQQQNYLMGIPGGSDLAETPVSPTENHYFNIDGVSEILPDGTLKGSFTLKAEGQSDAAVRRYFTNGYKQNWRITIEKELLKVSPLAKIILLDFGDPYDYMKEPVTINLQYEIPRYALISETEIIFTPLVAANLFRNSMGHMNASTAVSDRKYPFRDRSSRQLSLKENIRLPFQCEMAYKPDLKEVNGESTSYRASINLKGNELQMSQTADFRKRVYEPSDWPDYRQAVINQAKMAEESLILKRK